MTKNLNKILDLVKRAKAGNRDITEEELKELQDETPKEDETPTECKEKKSDEEVDTPMEDDEIPAEEDIETPTDDDPKEDDIDDKSDEDVETPMEDETPTDDDKEDNSNVRMNKNFSLLKTIRSVSKNQPLDELTNAVIEQGKSEMRNAGLSAQGQLVIPTNEVRAIHSVTADGEKVVATEVFDILTPLRAKNVLAQAGATIYSNLTSDVKIPIM